MTWEEIEEQIRRNNTRTAIYCAIGCLLSFLLALLGYLF